MLDNYSVDVVDRIGLGYAQLCKVKPDIVNLRMPGLGTTGPKRYYSTVGVNITAFTGLTYLWNHPGVTHPPIGAQTVFPDYVSGVLCAIIIISGVLHRDRQKKGAFIDMAQSEATAFMIGASLMEAVTSGKDPQPVGNTSAVAAPHDCYPCKGEDRWCVIAVENDSQWSALAKILGGEIDGDARFKTMDDRLRNRRGVEHDRFRLDREARRLRSDGPPAASRRAERRGANRRRSGQRSRNSSSAVSLSPWKIPAWGEWCCRIFRCSSPIPNSRGAGNSRCSAGTPKRCCSDVVGYDRGKDCRAEDVMACWNEIAPEVLNLSSLFVGRRTCQ